MTRGFLNVPRSNVSLVVTVAVYLLLCSGCSSSQEAQRAPASESRQESLKDFLERHESTFRPSDYNRILDSLAWSRIKVDSGSAIQSPIETARPETTAGFRVQILLTQDIDHAAAIRREITEILPDESVYIVYELPYYKIRVGNFVDRTEAGQMLRELQDLGYKDAWIVPDRILLNPSPTRPGSSTSLPDSLRKKD